MHPNSYKTPIHTLMAYTGVANAHGPSPQQAACRSPTCSLTTPISSNQALGKV